MTRRRQAAPGGWLVRALAGVLILGGTAVLAPVGWQLWVQDPAAASAQTAAAAAQSARWSSPRPTPTTSAPARIPVHPAPTRVGATVAVLRVPRFGASWQRIVRQGVDETAVLNSFTAGVGHYDGTAMPGGIGNFAVAGHDTGWGDAFRRLGELRIGDRIVVQTRDGWYTYAFRNFEWVQPTAVAVLNPVPTTRRAAAARLITLTTCDPPYDAQERMVAYGVLTGFRPARTITLRYRP